MVRDNVVSNDVTITSSLRIDVIILGTHFLFVSESSGWFMPKNTKLRLHLLKLFRENCCLLFSGHGVVTPLHIAWWPSARRADRASVVLVLAPSTPKHDSPRRFLTFNYVRGRLVERSATGGDCTVGGGGAARAFLGGGVKLSAPHKSNKLVTPCLRLFVHKDCTLITVEHV